MKNQDDQDAEEGFFDRTGLRTTRMATGLTLEEALQVAKEDLPEGNRVWLRKQDGTTVLVEN